MEALAGEILGGGDAAAGLLPALDNADPLPCFGQITSGDQCVVPCTAITTSNVSAIFFVALNLSAAPAGAVSPVPL